MRADTENGVGIQLHQEHESPTCRFAPVFGITSHGDVLDGGFQQGKTWIVIISVPRHDPRGHGVPVCYRRHHLQGKIQNVIPFLEPLKPRMVSDHPCSRE